ncbi:transcriptional regulator CynR [Pseudomonas sp. NPDC088444]|uniref:transcriptional regulator CynR n=1 Tax=Pseudomonas sp. NPDC088444 TaxID=3364456 RepID=UPI00384EC75C
MLLRHLKYLLAVADHGNFSRAAQALHVSQPTLSQQIRQLEDSLGAELLDRSARTVRPTDAGAVYIEYARQVMRDLEAGQRAIHDVKDLSRGALRLAMTPTFMAYLAGPLIRDFSHRHPAIRLSVFELSLDEIESRLADDSLDLAIAFTDVRHPDIDCVSLFVEQLSVMVGASHPLFGRADPLSADELATLPLVLLTKDFVTRTCIDDYCRAHGVTPRVDMQANSVSAILEIVRHMPMATILPQDTAAQMRGVFAIPFQDDAPQRSAALLRRRNVWQSAASVEFERMLKHWCEARNQA